MKIEEFGTLQMNRINQQHFGTSKIQNATFLQTAGTEDSSKTAAGKSTFQDYLIDAMNTVNNQQLDVSKIQEKIITNPDEVDVHDVTIAMAKARMSLNLAQTVIDRLVSGWNEITTTR